MFIFCHQVHPLDRAIVASRFFDTMVNLWKVADMSNPILTLSHTSKIEVLCFSPDGKYLVTGSLYGTVSLWGTKNREAPIRTFTDHTSLVYYVDFSHDGTQILSESNDNTAQVWDPSTCHTLKFFNLETNVWSAKFSPNRDHIVVGLGDNTVTILSLGRDNPIKTFLDHTSVVFSVDYNPERLRIVSGSKDFTVKLWVQSCGLGLYGIFPNC